MPILWRQFMSPIKLLDQQNSAECNNWSSFELDNVKHPRNATPIDIDNLKVLADSNFSLVQY
jgi:hypothetical protein